MKLKTKYDDIIKALRCLDKPIKLNMKAIKLYSVLVIVILITASGDVIQ